LLSSKKIDNVNTVALERIDVAVENEKELV
jgi:hypothetical protein